MRHALLYMGLLGMLGLLACGIKGPPRPPPKEREGAPAAQGTQAQAPGEAPHGAEEKPPFEFEEELP